MARTAAVLAACALSALLVGAAPVPRQAVTFSQHMDVHNDLASLVLHKQTSEVRRLFASEMSAVVAQSMELPASFVRVESVVDEAVHRRMQAADSKCTNHNTLNKCLTIKYVIMCSKGCQDAKSKVESMKNLKKIQSVLNKINSNIRNAVSVFNAQTKLVTSSPEDVVASISKTTVVTMDVTPPSSSTLEYIGSYETGLYGKEATVSLVYDAPRKNLITASKATPTITFLTIDGDKGHVRQPTVSKTIDVAKVITDNANMMPAGFKAGTVTSLVIAQGTYLCATVTSAVANGNGYVFLFDLTKGASFALAKEVGGGPQGLTVSADGSKLACVNKGSFSVTVMTFVGAAVKTTKTTGFTGLNAGDLTGKYKVRLFGADSDKPEKNLQPVSCSFSGSSLLVNLQVNNAMASLDLATSKWNWVRGYGYFSSSFDPSDKDGTVAMRTSWEGVSVKQMPQPKGVASFTHKGATYVATANQGAMRGDGARLSARKTNCPGAQGVELIKDAQLGRLSVTTTTPANVDGAGRVSCATIYTFGSRSFSIFKVDNADADPLSLVYNSGSDFETVAKRANKAHFNDNGAGFDSASADKGPEPASITVSEGVNGKRLAFIGLMGSSGVMVYDISDPKLPRFQDYVNHRNWQKTSAFTGTAEDPAIAGGVNPQYNGEGWDFGVDSSVLISETDSPTCFPLLAVANCLSGSVSLYKVTEQDFPFLRADDASCMSGTCSTAPPTDWCGCHGGCGASGAWSLAANKPISNLAKVCNSLNKWGVCGMGACSCSDPAAPATCSSSTVKVQATTAGRGGGTANSVHIAFAGDVGAAEGCRSFMANSMADGTTKTDVEVPKYGTLASVKVSVDVAAGGTVDPLVLSELIVGKSSFIIGASTAAIVVPSSHLLDSTPFLSATAKTKTLQLADAYNYLGSGPKASFSQSSMIQFSTALGTNNKVSFYFYGKDGGGVYVGPYLAPKFNRNGQMVDGVEPNTRGRSTWLRFDTLSYGAQFTGFKLVVDGAAGGPGFAFTSLGFSRCNRNQYTGAGCTSQGAWTGNWNVKPGESAYFGF